MNFTPLIETVPVAGGAVGAFLFFGFGLMMISLLLDAMRLVKISTVFGVVAFIIMMASIVSIVNMVNKADEDRAEVAQNNVSILQSNISEKYAIESDDIKVADSNETPLNGAGTYTITVDRGSSLMEVDVKFEESGEPTILTTEAITPEDFEALMRDGS